VVQQPGKVAAWARDRNNPATPLRRRADNGRLCPARVMASSVRAVQARMQSANLRGAKPLSASTAPMPDPRNVLLTGIPRSGTTLAGALIDSLPDTVCISEPPWHWHRASGGKLDIGPDPDGSVFARWLVGDFVAMRAKLLRGETVQDRRAADAAPLTNYHDAGSAGAAASTTRHFSRSGLSANFTLAVKHNGPYLTALQQLLELEWFTVVAIVREPVAVIHSWRSLNLPVSRGRMHDAARCWPELEQATSHGSVLERQVRIYDLICERLHRLRERIHIVPYEAMVEQPALLSQAIGATTACAPALISAPSRRVPPEEQAIISAALRQYGSHYRLFYPES